MLLGKLIANTGFTADGGLDLEIRGVTADSRRVIPGNLFCVVDGAREDGARYLDEALARGAAAVAGRGALASRVAGRRPWIELDDDRAGYGRLCDRFFGEPSRDLDVIGVTGTNGKSTTTGLVAAMFGESPGGCARFGTVDVDLGDGVRPSAMTTPAPEDLHAGLAEVRERGLARVAMEVSSHALDQRRVDAVRFRAAVYTSLGRDHLDYHGSLDAYRAAKARFAGLLERGSALVLNDDDTFVRELEAPAGVDVLRYSVRARGAATALRLDLRREDARGIEADLVHDGRRATLASPLFGEHNRENLLAAAAAGLALGLDLDDVAAGLARFRGVAGRLERIELGAPFDCFVDYAHTPDAFARVLPGLARIAVGRLVLVFGCGGDKDRGKRPVMGELAARHADVVILTTDNPRSEDPAAIAADVAAGADEPDEMRFVADRREAIRAALDLARPGDLVLLAGKGHERSQVIGDVSLPWDDRAEARAWAGGAVDGESEGAPC